MRVKAINSFVGRHAGRKYIVKSGDVLELPAGADWLRAGLVVAIENVDLESEETPAAAEKPARKPRTSKK
jgi:hypothetical protein